jgi:hypothetical protein
MLKTSAIGEEELLWKLIKQVANFLPLVESFAALKLAGTNRFFCKIDCLKTELMMMNESIVKVQSTVH